MASSLKELQKQFDDLKKEFEEFKSSIKRQIIKKGLDIGDTFEIAGLKWKILDIKDKGYFCLADKLEDNMQFDKNFNDWKESSLRKFLNSDIYRKIADEIGAENIISFERDLLSLDGHTEYGKCEDFVSLLSFDEYRKYRALIPNTDNYWWWLITPDSTKYNGDKELVRVVSPSGRINYGSCYSCCGVRPFCIFSSSIFESEE